MSKFNYHIQTTTDELKKFMLRFESERKRAIFEIAEKSIYKPQNIEIFQCKSKKLPKKFDNQLSLQIEIIPSVIDYYRNDDEVVWAVNFADPNIFQYYGTDLFAQDEIQVAEHPFLASIREMLLVKRFNTNTIDDNGFGSNMIFTNIPRMCSIEISDKIYGVNFKNCDLENILYSTKTIHNSISNIIAMSSLFGFDGLYRAEQIGWLISNAYSAFVGAKLISNTKSCSIQTGFWGCGAFGGNKTLMIIVQIIVAHLSRVEKISFYIVNQKNLICANEAVLLAKKLLNNFSSTECIINELVNLNFNWRNSDKN